MSMEVGRKTALNAAINVTPLADVMLVLLIIIMLIAPLLQQGVPLTLPQASNTAEKPDRDDNTTLAVTADGRFFVDNQPTAQTDLLNAINRALDRKFERIVLIKADDDAPYSVIMDLMDSLQRAGIEDIALVTERRLRSGRAGG